jgi:hypothetical protein
MVVRRKAFDGESVSQTLRTARERLGPRPYAEKLNKAFPVLFYGQSAPGSPGMDDMRFVLKVPPPRPDYQRASAFSLISLQN